MELSRGDRGDVIRCRELRQGDPPRVIGELEGAVFAAALVIDRDGILAEKACEVLEQEVTTRGGAVAVPVSLPGATGFRAEAVRRAPLAYVYVFALAPHDLGVDGGVVVTIRSATPDWPAAEHMLRSLRVLTRNGRVATNYDADDTPLLPMVPPLPKRD